MTADVLISVGTGAAFFCILVGFFSWRDRVRKRKVEEEIDAVIMASNVANDTGETQEVYISGLGTIKVYPHHPPTTPAKGLFDVYEDEYLDHLHPSHKVLFSSGGSDYDYICERCGNTDLVPGGWGKLAAPCPIPLEEQ